MQKLLADKGYDANYIVEYVGIDKAVIPSRSMRINPREYDYELYKERNLVERMFNKLKAFQKGSHKVRQALNSFLIVRSYRCFSCFVKMNVDTS